MRPLYALLKSSLARRLGSLKLSLRRPFPAKRLAAARISARLCDRLPDQPGLWLRTTKCGAQAFYSVKDRNGVLYATVGGPIPVAVPVARLQGYWVLLD
jgi:hypothetical protein